MTNWYVRPNGGSYGNENGSDWSNAFDGMPLYTSSFWSVVQPMDTIYIAGGTYNTTWRIEASGNNNGDIIIKKATTSNHGTDIGWQDNFNNQVVITQDIEIWDEDYITIDGSVWNGIKMAAKSDYRISLSPDNAHPSDYITIKYIEVIGDGYGGSQNSRALQSTPSTGSTTNLTIQYCNFHDYGTAIVKINDASNVLIEHCEIHNTHPGATANHVDWIITYTSNGTIRYNKFYDTRHAGLAFANNSGQWDVYGNIIYQTGGFVGQGNLVECQRNTRLYFYNNTVAGGYHGLDTLTRTGYPNTTGNAYNNIFYNNIYNYLGGPAYVHDYNWYSVSNIYGEINGQSGGSDIPFINIDFHDYHLKTHTNPGILLSPPYDTDIDGNKRGLDGIWDRGTYEYLTQGCPTPIVSFYLQLLGS